MRSMSFVAVPGNTYVRLPRATDEQVARSRGYTAAEIGGENPYDQGTAEYECFQFAYEVGRKYQEEKRANGGRIPSNW